MQHLEPLQSVQLGDLRSPEQLAAEHPDVLTVNALRWQLRHRAENGLATCCVAVGKKLLISKSRYEGWLATQAGKGRAAA
jgi:hypothetical protein